MSKKPRYLALTLALSLAFAASLLVSWAARRQSPTALGSAAVRGSKAVAGQSATLLPDGHWLLIGGEGPAGPLATAAIRDAATGAVTSLPSGLQHARAWHTATLLPDGTVVVLGGVGANGRVVDIAELFNPETQKFETLAATGLTARASHTATLLTEGRVLVAGGASSEGETLGRLELWDPRTGSATLLPIQFLTPRRNHTATLLADGSVLLWGGTDKFGTALNFGEVFDPERQHLRMETLPVQADGQPPRLEASVPQDGATDVPVNTVVALRFSKPLRVQTVNAGSVTLRDPQGGVAAKVIPAEAGMLAFVTPQAPLLAGTTYTVSLSGSKDVNGLALPDTTLTFTTAGTRPAGETGIVGSGSSTGGGADSPWRKLPPLHAPPGVTALAGQVLQLSGEPLANVTLRIGSNAARTDGTGRFLLAAIPSGHQVMWIDGRTASMPKWTYGIFEDGVDVFAGRTNVLSYTIWMPLIDTAHAVTISSPTTSETVVTTPLITGLELRLPAQTTIVDHEGQVVTQVSITPIPVNQPPFPLPAGVVVPLYFTIQPGGAYLQTPNGAGARLVYPNYTHALPGTRANFWNYDAEEKGWYVYGAGTVDPQGRQVIPDPGVAIYEFTGAMINVQGFSPPGTWPPPGNDCGSGGDPVDCATGLFVYQKTDVFLPDVTPLALTRTYRPGDGQSRSFGIGTTHPYDAFLWSASQFEEADFILPDGGRVHFVRISSGTFFNDAVLQSTSTPTRFYRAQIVWNGKGWNMTLKDGTVYVFGENAPLQSIRDRYGNQITLTRTNGQSGNITQVTSPSGRWIQFTYDTSNRITQAQDDIGRVVSYTYDASGRLSTVTDANGGITTYTYDSSNNMLTVKDARGIVHVTNQYDANGRVTKQTLGDNSTYQFAYTLDANGKVTQTNVTDPRGNARQLTFNSSGYTLTNTYAVGKPEQQATTYNRQAGTNLVLNSTDALNRTTAMTYDVMGNVTSVTRLAGTANAATTSFTYEPTFRQTTSVTDPLNHTTLFSYDAKGNLIGLTDPLGNKTTYAYNAASQPVSVADPLGNTTQFAYDGADLVGITDPLGRTTTRTVDSAGRLVAVTDPLGNTTRYAYDALSQLTSVTDPLKGVTSFSYDPNGNLLSLTDPRNTLNPTTYTYENLDRLATRKDPLLNVESYQYDAAGNLAQFTDRRGKVTTFTYDGLNRKTFAGFGTQAGPTYESTVSYTYDAGNRLTQAVDSISGTITRNFDGLDRLTSEATPQGTVSYTYDVAGRRSTMTVAGQPVVNYSYDNANRLTQITQGTSTVSFTYDNANRRTSLALPNGIVVSYSYDTASQLAGVTYQSGATTLGNLSYAYDLAGRRSQVGGSFARTGLPNAVTTAAYNADNQLTQWGTATLTYDANGNMTSSGTDGYTWDARNRLVSTLSGASFQYDPFGRRASRTIGGVGTQFLFDGVNPVQELSGTTPVGNLLTGLGVDEIFTRTDAGGTRNFLGDALGSTLGLADSSGALLTQYTYEPFGNTSVSGSTNANSYQYTGRENDGTGLYFYRARYYNQQVGRFISEDPRYSGPNFYAYVGNDPLDGIDPYGLRCIRKIVLLTAYCDIGPGKDWPYYAPKSPGGKPGSVGPGTVATANTNPPPYPFGSSVTVSGDPDPFFHSQPVDSFNTPAYTGCIHDTGAGWNPQHHNVPPDSWLDIWLPCKEAKNWGKQWRMVTICTPDGGCGCK